MTTYYAYSTKKHKTSYLGVIKVEDGKDPLKLAKKKWPEAKKLDLLLKKYVIDKRKGTMKGPEAPWKDAKDWIAASKKYYAKKKGKKK